MKILNKKNIFSFFITMLMLTALSVTAFASEGDTELVSNYHATLWHLFRHWLQSDLP